MLRARTELHQADSGIMFFASISHILHSFFLDFYQVCCLFLLKMMGCKDEEKLQGRLEFLPMEPPPPYNNATSFPPNAPSPPMSMAQPSQQPIQSHPSMSSIHAGPQGSLPVNQIQPGMTQQNQQMFAPPAMVYQPPMMHTNTIVVTQAASSRTVVIEKKPKMQHWLHCLISLLFPPWLCVWIVLCIVNSRKQDKKTVL